VNKGEHLRPRQFFSLCCVPEIIKVGQCFTELFKNVADIFLKYGVYGQNFC